LVSKGLAGCQTFNGRQRDAFDTLGLSHGVKFRVLQGGFSIGARDEIPMSSRRLLAVPANAGH
jgi:hypothetical protein